MEDAAERFDAFVRSDGGRLQRALVVGADGHGWSSWGLFRQPIAIWVHGDAVVLVEHYDVAIGPDELLALAESFALVDDATWVERAGSAVFYASPVEHEFSTD